MSVDEDSRPPVNVGDLVADRFELLRTLPPGGSSIAYVARDLLVDETVVVKIGRGLAAVDPSIRDQYLKMRRLHSPSIVDCLGFFMHRRHAVLALEFIDGVPLVEFAKSGSEATLIRVFLQTAVALDELHANGLRHGDITKNNVLVIGERPVLIDPDATGIPSTLYAPSDDYTNLVGVIRATRCFREHPHILDSLDRLRTELRPFAAMAEVLRETRRDRLLADPQDRRNALKEVVAAKASAKSGKYVDVVSRRIEVFSTLVNEIDVLVEGLGVRPPDVDEVTDRASFEKERQGLPDGRGTLISRQRTWSYQGGEWSVVLQGQPAFSKPAPWPLPCIGLVTSSVVLHDGEVQTSTRLRMLDSSGGVKLEQQTSLGWIPAPEDWGVWTLEILVGERVAALGEPVELPGEKQDPDRMGSDLALPLRTTETDFASVIGAAALRQKLEIHLNTEPGQLQAAPTFGSTLKRTMSAASVQHAKMRLLDCFTNEFIPTWSSYFVSCDRYDLVRSSNEWSLELIGRLATADTRSVRWFCRLPGLTTNW